jgi:hypothetical protein
MAGSPRSRGLLNDTMESVDICDPISVGRTGSARRLSSAQRAMTLWPIMETFSITLTRGMDRRAATGRHCRRSPRSRLAREVNRTRTLG